MNKQKQFFDEDILHMEKMSELIIKKAQESSDTEINKIESMVKAIGKDTLVELARAGPESQAKILGGLGIKSLLITDGKNPVNLFNTSLGLLGNLPGNNDN